VTLPSWLVIAHGEEDIRDIRGPRHHPRVLEYLRTCSNLSRVYRNRDETPWCSAFVNWCLLEAGYCGTSHALASSWLRWGFRLDEPQLGAIAVIRRRGAGGDTSTGSRTGNHVAFVLDSNSKRLTLWGGNQRDRVKRSVYPLDRYYVRGLLWPWNPADE
jgi:uncharacterized protein (TIGR02594 family)